MSEQAKDVRISSRTSTLSDHPKNEISIENLQRSESQHHIRAQAVNNLCYMLAERITSMKHLSNTQCLGDTKVQGALIKCVREFGKLKERAEQWWDLLPEQFYRGLSLMDRGR